MRSCPSRVHICTLPKECSYEYTGQPSGLTVVYRPSAEPSADAGLDDWPRIHPPKHLLTQSSTTEPLYHHRRTQMSILMWKTHILFVMKQITTTKKNHIYIKKIQSQPKSPSLILKSTIEQRAIPSH